MIYINGYWNRITGFLGLSPGTPDEAYWNYFSPFFISSSLEFMGATADEPKRFIDGSSLFGIDQSAEDRYLFGLKYAQEHCDELVNELKRGESFRMISHSEGGAFAAGMAEFLLSRGLKVERMLYLSPREAGAFRNPKGAFAIQVHFINDPICAPKRLNGVDIYCKLRTMDGRKVGLRAAHGATVKATVINKVKDLLEILLHENNNLQIEGSWTITETREGYDFTREDVPDSQNK